MSTPIEPSEPPEFACPHCQSGTLHPRTVTFAHWYEDQFITIPNFPGWVCDLCGEREYDAAAIEQLELILGPEVDFRRETKRRARFGPAKPKTATRPTGRRRI